MWAARAETAADEADRERLRADAAAAETEAAEDPHREVRDEAELSDPVLDAERDDVAATPDDPRPVAETAVPDVREISTPDATEHTDPAQRQRLPSADETAEAVARAQAALGEIAARQEADEAREAAEAARRDELARFAEQDRAAEVARRRTRTPSRLRQLRTSASHATACGGP